MERRQFLTWMGLGFLVTTSSATIAACQSAQVTSDTTADTAPLEVPPPPPSAEEVNLAEGTNPGYVLGTVAELDEKGVLSGRPDFVDATVLVIRDPQAPATLYALNATCPHEQCDVEWKSNQSEFVCPCHTGKFAPDGTVLAKPPTSNLTPYRAKIEGDTVIVSPS